MTHHIQWTIKTFDELSNEELYQILRFRIEIFMLEQNCIYVDLDQKDQKAYHFCGKNKENLIAYSRINSSMESAFIQRVAVHSDFRHQKLGTLMITKILDFIENNFSVENIQLNAQQHLQLFYEKLGFQVAGYTFDDHGIWHVPMIKKIN